MFATIFLICFYICAARNSFPDYLPNGRNVMVDGQPWVPLGHLDKNAPSGGNGLNLFGQDVKRTLRDGFPDWEALCPLDSDLDGLTNGEELLDPDCLWSKQLGSKEVLVEGNATHPGIPGDAPVNFETPLKIKLHAAFMTLAWLVFAPAGILTAIIFKVKTKSVKSFNWFKIHKVCVGTAVYLTLVAYVCMVYEREDFLFINEHTRIGHAVVILAIIQPITGFYRIHLNEDGTKSFIRLAWEYLHQWAGRSLVVLSVIAIYFGYDIAGFVDDDLATAVQVVSILLLIVGGLFAIAWVFIRKDERKEPDLPVKQEQPPQQQSTQPEPVEKDSSIPVAEVIQDPVQKKLDKEKTNADKVIEEVKQKQVAKENKAKELVKEALDKVTQQ